MNLWACSMPLRYSSTGTTDQKVLIVTPFLLSVASHQKQDTDCLRVDKLSERESLMRKTLEVCEERMMKRRVERLIRELVRRDQICVWFDQNDSTNNRTTTITVGSGEVSLQLTNSNSKRLNQLSDNRFTSSTRSSISSLKLLPSTRATHQKQLYHSTNKLSMADRSIPRTEEEWRLRLTPEQFRILRKKGTEMAGTGELNKHKADYGVYECAGCSAPLYRFDHKFDSGCGWPAFFDAIPGAVSRNEDRSFGTIRTEITCTNCGGHLGHVFLNEGFRNPTNERHCVNSVSIKFNEKA
ncbi:Mss4-like protein [Phakopsora pachyrhizi]|uniref:Peptide-methionine (R)-S-oxide reductase n=1 Tax=Phakopsora pachyrhizi TaxID=170000 RepID=A0AAV0AQ34_PHAPC|nr:Mss4-like protein [Phakopsora pachyrhizi]CAH7671053.1 Mss4-like protein [Phakopsora pachyrhizi]